MYVAKVPNRGSPPAILIREGYREGGKAKTRTLANIPKLPPQTIDAIERSLKGQRLLPPEQIFEILQDGSAAHGHVEAVMTAMRRLRLDNLIASRPSRMRDLVLAMVAVRILVLEPPSKLATARWWHGTTLPDLLGVTDADQDELYEAMDWLLERQSTIEKKLAVRHLEDKGLVLYDLSSTYFEGVTCPLAARGHNRDGKQGKLQVNWGLLTNRQGIPVSISLFDGNTNDTKTLLPQVAKMRESFGFEHFVVVGDRGMIMQKQINTLENIQGVDWVTALPSAAIRKLVEKKHLQLGLFDERNLFEIRHPDFDDQRLIACRNPELARHRMHKRESLLQATCELLHKVQKMTQHGRIQGRDAIEARCSAAWHLLQACCHQVGGEVLIFRAVHVHGCLVSYSCDGGGGCGCSGASASSALLLPEVRCEVGIRRCGARRAVFHDVRVGITHRGRGRPVWPDAARGLDEVVHFLCLCASPKPAVDVVDSAPAENPPVLCASSVHLFSQTLCSGFILRCGAAFVQSPGSPALPG